MGCEAEIVSSLTGAGQHIIVPVRILCRAGQHIMAPVCIISPIGTQKSKAVKQLFACEMTNTLAVTQTSAGPRAFSQPVARCRE